MSLTENVLPDEELINHPKRKRESNEEDLEIDLDAPEPPSKKALRAAKKGKSLTNGTSTDVKNGPKPGGKDDDEVMSKPDKRSEFGIWIGNLSFNTTKDDLVAFLQKDPECPIPNDKVTRINLPPGPVKFGKFQNKGFAYIDFADAATLRSALQLSEKLLAGRRVLIKDAKSFEGRPQRSGDKVPSVPPSKRVFVGNLSFDTTVEDIEKHFGVCGPIQHTQVATFEDSGKCKGYAWIEFEQLSSGEAAMRGWVEQDSAASEESAKRSKQRIWLSKMNGRKLRLEYAEDKTTRYNKRFGKKGGSDKTDEEAPAIEEVNAFPQNNADSSQRAQAGLSNDTAKKHYVEGGKNRKQRYADETVKRLTGAIVESQGQKLMFD